MGLTAVDSKESRKFKLEGVNVSALQLLLTIEIVCSNKFVFESSKPITVPNFSSPYAVILKDKSGLVGLTLRYKTKLLNAVASSYHYFTF